MFKRKLGILRPGRYEFAPDQITLCDFGEVLDPPTVDVTAHVVEALAYLGWTVGTDRLRGHWHLSKTAGRGWQLVWPLGCQPHLRYGRGAAGSGYYGEDMSAKYVRLAGDSIAHHRNADGGWGETPASFVDDSLRGIGDGAASQTAWALMALLAIPTARYAQIIHTGVEYLLSARHEGTGMSRDTPARVPGIRHGSPPRGKGAMAPFQ